MNQFRRTRIVATIGPASGSISMLTRMMQAGLDIARLNFSHGTHDGHKDYIAHIRAAARRTNAHVAILQDLQGPKIRIGNIEPMQLEDGEHITLIAGSKGLKGEIPVTLSSFAKDVKKGDRILLNDGFIELMVVSKKGKKVSARVVQGGPLTSHKGVNFPDSHVSGSAFTEKDHEDLLFGIAHGVDYIALSFVEQAKEVAHIREIVMRAAKKAKVLPPRIIAKIERKEAINNFIDILPFVDGIMVARGDLGLEIPFEEVPMIQKELVEMCRLAGKPVIVATHMLESMTKNIRPTRAEVSDVANAVIDRTDAVMLSAETASGEHPYASIQTMDRVIRETEYSYLNDINLSQYTEDVRAIFAQTLHRLAVSGSIEGIAIQATDEALVHKAGVYRPHVPIFVFCPNEEMGRRFILHSAVVPVVVKNMGSGSFEMGGHRELIRQKCITKKAQVAFIHESADGKLHLTLR